MTFWRPFIYMPLLAALAGGFLLSSCAQDKESSSVRRSNFQHDSGAQSGPADTQAQTAAQESLQEEEPEAGPSSNEGGPPPPASLATSPDVFLEGERGYDFEPFELPEVIRQRQIRRGQSVESDTSYLLHRAHLVIDLEQDRMRVDIDIEAAGRREQVLLTGSFDRQARNWTANLYAADTAIRNERRIQAVVLCLRPFICDQIWMDLYYLVNGELKRRQFVVGAEEPQISLSEEQSIPLPEPDESGHIRIPPMPAGPAHPEEEEEIQAGPPALEQPEEQPQPEPIAPPAPLAEPEAEEETPAAPNPPPALAAPEEEEQVNRPPVPPMAPVPQPDEPPVVETQPPVPPQRPEPEEEPEFIPPVPTPRPEYNVVHIDDVTIEYGTEMQLPPPEASDFQVQGVESLNLSLSNQWSPQAQGAHTNGYLTNASLLQPEGCGYRRRDVPSSPVSRPSEDTTASWGTDLMLEMIAQAACAVENQVPGRPPLLIGNISRRTGGQFGRHSSHQTGLDADLAFYRRSNSTHSFWNAVNEDFNDFDFERNWLFLKALHSTDSPHLMIIFVDRQVKAQMCDYVRRTEGLPTDSNSVEYKALRFLRHWAGHANHYHIRLYCPGTQGCRNWQADPNFQGTGC